MAEVSLTDNEKQRLDEILSDLDNLEIEQSSQETDGIENAETSVINAYALMAEDKKRISEIDSLLGSFCTNQSNLSKPESYWQNLLLENTSTLKEVDEKLDEDEKVEIETRELAPLGNDKRNDQEKEEHDIGNE